MNRTAVIEEMEQALPCSLSLTFLVGFLWR
jgi:hypothetical protein